jgi:TolA-binding protein
VSVVDLHPENLLDKEIQGALDATERERLEAHLAQCATCRLERRLRADFALELSRESVPPRIAGLVESLAKAPAPATRTATVETLASSRGTRRRVVFLVAAATLTLVASAFASTEAGRRTILTRLFGGAEATSPYVEAPAATPSHASPTAVRSAAPLTDPVPAREALPQPTSSSAAPVVPPAVASPSAPTPPETPLSLFNAEAQARRRGDGARVLELHALLVARYPQSREAQVSRMMVARLMLDRGDAAGAVAGFDAYLRAGSGDLREDALAGRATALDRLGRTDEARHAWMALLDEYPASAYATHARARVDEPDEH